jgi:hypothetical protein
MLVPFVISAMLAGDPRVLPQLAGAVPRAAPRSDAERQRAVFDDKLAAYVRLAAEIGGELVGGDFDDDLAYLLDDERMTTFLGLAMEMSRDVATSTSLRAFAKEIERHEAPRGPLFARPEVTAFITWLERIGDRFDVDALLQLTTSLPTSFVSAETAGREFVHVLYDPALTAEMRTMLYAVVRVSGRSAVLYHARSGDLDSDIVARLFATHEDDARAVDRLFALVMLENGVLDVGDDGPTPSEIQDLHQQVQWNRSVLEAWMARVRTSERS